LLLGSSPPGIQITAAVDMNNNWRGNAFTISVDVPCGP